MFFAVEDEDDSDEDDGDETIWCERETCEKASNELVSGRSQIEPNISFTQACISSGAMLYDPNRPSILVLHNTGSHAISPLTL